MALSVADILTLFERRGAAQYGGEAVSQLEHALQCASLAAEAGARPPLVAACLLHDLGHLLAELRDGVEGPPDADDVHQYLAIPFLRGAFPDSVLMPMQLHVDAKRYLCATESAYWDSLSPASKHSLNLQGGPFDRMQARDFMARPYADDAVSLRRWDDLAKVPGKRTPPLSSYVEALRTCAAR